MKANVLCLLPGEPWDFLEQPLAVNKAIPLATVLTIPAIGSEMNNGSVISRRERKEKLFFFNMMLVIPNSRFSTQQ